MVHNTLTNISEISDGEIVMGESATVTGKARGGKVPYTYAMCYKLTDAEEYTMFRDFNIQAEAVFTPPADGTYSILVLVKDSLGVTADKEYTLKVNKKLANTSTVSKKKIVVGDTITVNAAATGGKGAYQYKISCKKASECAYTLIRNYSDKNTVSVTPEEAEAYNIRVAVRDERGAVVVKTFTVNVYSVLENNTEISSDIITLGDTVTVSAGATGGKAPYKYEVTYKKAISEKYSTAQSYSTNIAVNIKFSAAVQYDIHVNVKDALGQVIGKDFTVEVLKPLENTSVINAEEIIKGKEVTITASATGGYGDYQYTVLAKKEGSKSYSTVAKYSENSEIKYKPSSTGNYDIVVRAKDSKGNIARKQFRLKVNGILKNTSTISAETVKKGESVIVNACAEGGMGDYEYVVLFKKASSSDYTTASKFSNKSEVVITPGAATDYNIVVKVRDASAKTVRKEFRLTVEK